MLALVLVPIFIGVIGYYLPKAIAAALMLLGQGFLLAWAFFLFERARDTGAFYEGLGGERPLYIAFRGEQTALAFVLLTVVLSTAALIYTLGEPFFSTKLLLLMLIMQGLSIGILLTDDIFNLFVLIEVSTLVGVLLTMYRQGLRSAYDGLYYLTIQVVAMMFFLFGVAYLYQIFGVLSVSEMAAAIGAVPARALLLPVAFLLTGIAVKMGFFPLFSYVPHAYGNPGAPIAVLAMLSSVVVSGSIYWLSRLMEMFSGLPSLRPFIAAVAVATVIAGAVKALTARDIRIFLAFSTVSQAGLIALGLVSGTVARDGALLHILTHAVAKALLFLAAGVILDAYGTARLNQVRGAARRCPIAAVAIALALISLAGLPFTAGGVSKYWLAYDAGSGWLTAAMWLSTALTVLISLRFAMILFGSMAPAARTARWHGSKDAVVLALTLVLLALGVFGNQLVPQIVPWQQPIALASALEKGLITLAIAAAAVLVLRVLLRDRHYPQTEAAQRLIYRITRDGALSLPDAVLVMTAFFVAALGTGLLLGWAANEHSAALTRTLAPPELSPAKKFIRNLEVVVIFTLFWVVMNESASWIIFGSGVVISVFVLWLTNLLDHVDYANDLFRSPRVVVRYIAFVVKEMTLAAIEMAKVIITGRGRVVEAQYRSTLRDERKLFLLATAIIMTPGSITVFRRGGDLLVLSVADDVASVEASCEHLESRVAEITK